MSGQVLTDSWLGHTMTAQLVAASTPMNSSVSKASRKKAAHELTNDAKLPIKNLIR